MSSYASSVADGRNGVVKDSASRYSTPTGRNPVSSATPGSAASLEEYQAAFLRRKLELEAALGRPLSSTAAHRPVQSMPDLPSSGRASFPFWNTDTPSGVQILPMTGSASPPSDSLSARVTTTPAVASPIPFLDSRQLALLPKPALPSAQALSAVTSDRISLLEELAQERQAKAELESALQAVRVKLLSQQKDAFESRNKLKAAVAQHEQREAQLQQEADAALAQLRQESSQQLDSYADENRRLRDEIAALRAAAEGQTVLTNAHKDALGECDRVRVALAGAEARATDVTEAATRATSELEQTRAAWRLTESALTGALQREDVLVRDVRALQTRAMEGEDRVSQEVAALTDLLQRERVEKRVALDNSAAIWSRTRQQLEECQRKFDEDLDASRRLVKDEMARMAAGHASALMFERAVRQRLEAELKALRAGGAPLPTPVDGTTVCPLASVPRSSGLQRRLHALVSMCCAFLGGGNHRTTSYASFRGMCACAHRIPSSCPLCSGAKSDRSRRGGCR